MNGEGYPVFTFCCPEGQLEYDPFPTTDCPECEYDLPDGPTYSWEDDDAMDSDDYVDPDEEREKCRDSCFYGPDDEKKVCIWPLGGNFSWDDKSSGTCWIGVNGIDFICVVSMDSNQDPLTCSTCHLDSTKILHIAAADMKDKSSAIHQRMLGHCSRTGSMTGPFAVVSIAPDACQVPLKSDIEKAINFLTMKLKDRPSLTPEETEQIAVCALKCFFGSMFKSSEIMLLCSGNYLNYTTCPSKIEKYLNDFDQATTTNDLPASFSSLCMSSPELAVK